MMILRSLALAAATLLGGGAAGSTCTCPPPVIETVSALSGVSSFAGASVATGTTQFHGYPSELLTCPVGELAISAGYRTLLDTFNGAPPVMVQMTPVTGPTGDHARAYRFVWAPADDASGQQALGQVRVYVTCAKN